MDHQCGLAAVRRAAALRRADEGHPGISPKVLTDRLRALEEKGVVTREVMPSSPPSVEYALSDVGHELVPVIDSIVRVGTRLLGH